METTQRLNRSVTIVLETIMVVGWVAAMWLAVGLTIREDRDRLIHSLRYEAGELVAWIRGEREATIVVLDPVPSTTATP
jgi:hypothetical protein